MPGNEFCHGGFASPGVREAWRKGMAIEGRADAFLMPLKGQWVGRRIDELPPERAVCNTELVPALYFSCPRKWHRLTFALGESQTFHLPQLQLSLSILCPVF